LVLPKETLTASSGCCCLLLPNAGLGIEFRSDLRRGRGLQLFVQGDWPDPEGVLSRRNHRQRNRGTIRPGMKILRLQPCTEPRIVDLRLVMPKVWLQPTLDLEMIQMQLDDCNMPREIPSDIGCADV